MKKSLYLVVCAFAALLFAGQTHAQVVVIANANVSVDSISKKDLRAIFTGTSTNLGGARVRPVLLKDGAVHTEFLSSMLNEGPVAFIVVWRSQVMSGQSTMPKSFESEAALAEYVAKTPGAIGYVGKAASHADAKVLTVN